MTRRVALQRRFIALAGLALALVGAASCTEDIESSKSCPLLCPQPPVPIRDTTIEAIIVDSTVAGFPAIGTEPVIPLTDRNDTMDVRGVVRFDTLLATYTTKTGADSAITHVDSAFLFLRVYAPDSMPRFPVTVQVFDVDMPGDSVQRDTSAARLAALFTADRLLGSYTYAIDTATHRLAITDTLRIRINPDTVYDRIANGTRLRLGLRVVADSSIQLNIGTAEGGGASHLRMWVAPDTFTTAQMTTMTPFSPDFLRNALADYRVPVIGSPPTPAGVLEVGGIPGRRTYLRFRLPQAILDSSTMVRATLLLTQLPNPGSAARSDTISITAAPLLGGAAITDIERLLRLVSSVHVDTVATAPADSGVVSFELIRLVQSWAATDSLLTPRALGLSSSGEGERPQLIRFYSNEAAQALRPRLRIVYVPREPYGLP